MQRKQPDDEWTFLRPDEFVDDNELDRLEAIAERGPEETAMHEVALGDRAVEDPGRADVETDALAPAEPPEAVYFDDEQPEQAPASADTEDSDEEPDLEQILESQHYAFEESEE